MTILYIGSSGALSLTPFNRLLDSGHNIVAVGIFNPLLFGSKVIALAPISLEHESLALTAKRQSIPLVIYHNLLKTLFINVRIFQSMLF